MDGVIPNPPAEFSALAMASWIFSDEMISCRYRATRMRPGDAKMSPMNKMFIRLKAGNRKRSAPNQWNQLPSLTPETRAEPSERL